MGILELFLVGVGLSMDAFAVSMCRGLAMRKFNGKHAVIIAVFFGGFQALMPLLGWLLGTTFAGYIQTFDHWIAFGLLVFIGGKMVLDAVKELRSGEEAECPDGLRIKELFIMAIATSIDALAVGVSFAFLEVEIWGAIGIIGATTFVLSIIGVWIGHKFGARFKTKAEIVGGLVLIGIGIKILVEHLLGL